MPSGAVIIIRYYFDGSIQKLLWAYVRTADVQIKLLNVCTVLIRFKSNIYINADYSEHAHFARIQRQVLSCAAQFIRTLGD